MRALRLVAFAPLSMELESADLPDVPPPGMLLVEARTTAISAGTEIANLRGITPYHSVANPDWRDHPYYPGYSLAGLRGGKANIRGGFTGRNRLERSIDSKT